MRSKKKPIIPDYEGMGVHPENAEIQKARPLQSLSETNLTLPEFKILDAYLARINSHDPEKRTVRLEKGELEKVLGVTRILKDDLNKRLRNLFQIIEVKDESKRKGFKLINLFEEADAEQDDDGLWQITLTCTSSAREYVFNIDNLGYLRYRLKSVINLTSRYSYVLFLYLLDNRFRKTWSITFEDLKTLLACNAERYKQFKFFNAEILKKCQKELSEKTDIRFEYKPVKRGRIVKAIEFTIIGEEEQLEGQISIDDLPALTDHKDYGSEELNNLASAVNFEFGKEELEGLIPIMDGLGILPENRKNYIAEKYAQLRVEEARKQSSDDKPIKHRYKYFLSMMDDGKSAKKYQKELKKKAHAYDGEEIQRQLLAQFMDEDEN